MSTLIEKERVEEKTFNQMNHKKERKDSVIDIKNLTIRYGEKIAVNNVSLPIRERSVTALIGPSGCGKSTFLRSINRMNDTIATVITEGQIFYQGLNLLRQDIDVYALRKAIGMVFQKPTPFPKSIYDNLTHALKFHGVKSKGELDFIVKKSLKEVSLWDEVRDRLHVSALQLSGGQQQRLVIAKALTMQPQILLLDEPTSALDPVSTAKIEQLINELKRKYTIIIVTHNMHQAARISDYTAFFLNGNLVEYNETSKLFVNPQMKETEDYITGRFG